MKKIIISGVTGFIGRAVAQSLLEEGYQIIGLSRNPERYQALFQNRIKFISWDARSSEGWWELAEGSLAFINLAGENIGSGLWTKKKKDRIIESRIGAGRAMTEAFIRVEEKPKTFIQASAIGYYGNGNNEVLTEISKGGQGFLADLTRKWEGSISGIDHKQTRVVVFRIGLVLGRGGGLLSKMSVPFRLFFGGHFGNGKQWMSWVHIQDVAGAIQYALEAQTLNGVCNLTSPSPVQARIFFSLLGKALHRPSWFHVPASLLKMLLGDMAEETLLTSQKVLPNRLLDAGYNFRYSKLDMALKEGL